MPSEAPNEEEQLSKEELYRRLRKARRDSEYADNLVHSLEDAWATARENAEKATMDLIKIEDIISRLQ